MRAIVCWVWRCVYASRLVSGVTLPPDATVRATPLLHVIFAIHQAFNVCMCVHAHACIYVCVTVVVAVLT